MQTTCNLLCCEQQNTFFLRSSFFRNFSTCIATVHKRSLYIFFYLQKSLYLDTSFYLGPIWALVVYPLIAFWALRPHGTVQFSIIIQSLIGKINSTLIKRKAKLSLNIKKFRWDRVQSHIWLTTSSYMGKNLCISSNIKKPFLIYHFAPDPIWISLYRRKV